MPGEGWGPAHPPWHGKTPRRHWLILPWERRFGHVASVPGGGSSPGPGEQHLQLPRIPGADLSPGAGREEPRCSAGTREPLLAPPKCQKHLLGRVREPSLPRRVLVRDAQHRAGLSLSLLLWELSWSRSRAPMLLQHPACPALCNLLRQGALGQLLSQPVLAWHCIQCRDTKLRGLTPWASLHLLSALGAPPPLSPPTGVLAGAVT